MDTSETYVKMCEGAGEIQKLKAYKVLFPGKDRIHIDSLGSYWMQKDADSTNWQVFWIPRQDQLQEMVGDDSLLSPLPQFLTFVFSDFKIARENNLIQRMFLSKYAFRFTSMEQLWLAFVMKEKYGEVWNGEDWVKEG